MSSYSGNKPKRLPLSTTRITELAYPPFSLHFLRPSPYFLPCFELYVFPASVTSTGDWRRQHNDGEVIGKPQQKLFAKSNPPPKKNKMGEARSTYGEEERCIQGFVWDTEGKRPLGRHRRRVDDNIKM